MSESHNGDQPWYRDGLRFECTQCGDCCTGAPGYVFVEPSEIKAMAAAMEMEVVDFERQYVRQVGHEKSLKEYSGGDCVLLDPKTRKCTVYDARPVQCRTWPFWDSNLETPRQWQQTCEVCPGSGKGRLYSIEEIEVARREKSV